MLFRPDLLGEECEGIHEVLMYAITKSDMDLRKILYQNIVLSGGSTLLKGFGDRLLLELKKNLPKDLKIRVRFFSYETYNYVQAFIFNFNVCLIQIAAPQERLYSTWMGGSILASLDTFKKMWVSKREFDEEGPRVIHRKTF